MTGRAVMGRLYGAATLFLGLACVLLWRQNGALRATARRGTELTEGAAASQLIGTNSTGEMSRIEFGRNVRRPTLILEYSETCPLCSLAWVRWRELIQDFPPTRLRLVFLDVGGYSLAADSAARAEFPQGTVLRTLAVSTALAYEPRLVPGTVLVNSRGVIAWAGAGPLDGKTVERLRGIIATDLGVDLRAQGGKK